MPYSDPQQKKDNSKRWYEENKQRILQKRKENYQNKTHKQNKIRSFKNQGFKGDLEEVYDIHMSTEFCNDCNVKLINGTSKNSRCADHNHITGYYRNTICMRCNFQRQYVDRKFINVLSELKTIHNLPLVLRRFIK